MKYDFNTNLIFVVRTNSPNGMFNIDGTLASLQLDVLDGTTGRRIYDRLDSQYFVNSSLNVKSLFDIQDIFTMLTLLFLSQELKSIFIGNSGINKLIDHLKGFDISKSFWIIIKHYLNTYP